MISSSFTAGTTYQQEKKASTASSASAQKKETVTVHAPRKEESRQVYRDSYHHRPLYEHHYSTHYPAVKELQYELANVQVTWQFNSFPFRNGLPHPAHIHRTLYCGEHQDPGQSPTKRPRNKV